MKWFVLLLFTALAVVADTRTNVTYHAEFAESPENNAALSPERIVMFRVWQTGDLKFQGITNGNNLTVIFSQPVKAGARFTVISTEWITNIVEVTPLYPAEIANASTTPSQLWPPRTTVKPNAPKAGHLAKLPAIKTKSPPKPGK